MIDTDFRAWLATLDIVDDPSVPGAIQQELIDQEGPANYIWFHRRSSVKQVNLDGSKRGFIESSYDVELVSNDIDTAQQMADTLKEELNGYRGTWTESFILGAFVEDHSDEYNQQNGADEGQHVCNLDVQIIHTDIS